MVALSASRNLALYLLAVYRGLKVKNCGGGHYRVSSNSRRGQWHDVFVTEGFYACACQQAYPKAKACSHGALASMRAFPELFIRWRAEAEAGRYRAEREAVRQGLLADIAELDAGLEKSWKADERWRESHGYLMAAA